jgi:Zn-finger nucleic acid-binding protein
MAHLRCPKCDQLLSAVLTDGVEVDTCTSCGGVWVEYSDEKKFLKAEPQVFSIDELRRLRKIYQPLGHKEPLQYYPCPRCGEMMWRKMWGSHSGVMVDRCGDHGTWFDKDEPEKIREFIAAGGIEFEKLRKTEKSLTDIDSRITRETTRLDLKVNSAYRRARLWSFLGF